MSWRSAPSKRRREHPDVSCQSPEIKQGLVGIEFGCNSAHCCALSCPVGSVLVSPHGTPPSHLQNCPHTKSYIVHNHVGKSRFCDGNDRETLPAGRHHPSQSHSFMARQREGQTDADARRADRTEGGALINIPPLWTEQRGRSGARRSPSVMLNEPAAPHTTYCRIADPARRRLQTEELSQWRSSVLSYSIPWPRILGMIQTSNK